MTDLLWTERAQIRPNQYIDKWRLDLKGVRPVPNDAVKQALGFGKVRLREREPSQ